MPTERIPQVPLAMKILKSAELVDPDTVMSPDLARRISRAGQKLPNSMPLYKVWRLAQVENDSDLSSEWEITPETAMFRGIIRGLVQQERYSVNRVIGDIQRNAIKTSRKTSNYSMEELHQSLQLDTVRIPTISQLVENAGIQLVTAAFLKVAFGDAEQYPELMEALNEVPGQITKEKSEKELSLEERIIQANDLMEGDNRLKMDNIRIVRERAASVAPSTSFESLTFRNKASSRGNIEQLEQNLLEFNQAKSVRKSSVYDPLAMLKQVSTYIMKHDRSLTVEDVRNQSFQQLEKILGRVYAAAAKLIFDPSTRISEPKTE